MSLNPNTVLLMHMDNNVSDATYRHSPSAIDSPNYISGKENFSNAINLNGSSQYIQIADSEDWNLGDSDFTIALWTKLNSPIDRNMLISQWAGGGSNGSFGFQTYASINRLYFFYSTNGSSEVSYYATGVSYSTDWTHFAAVRSGSLLILFVNGNIVGTHNIGTSILYNSTRNLNIGAYQDGGLYLNGAVDEVVFIKGKAVWTSNFTPPPNPYSNPENLINMFSYAIGNEQQARTALNFNNVITSATFGKIYEGQYTQDSNARIYGDVEKKKGSYKIKFFADENNLYKIAEHDSIYSSGENVPIIGSGVGVGMSGVFSYNLGI